MRQHITRLSMSRIGKLDGVKWSTEYPGKWLNFFGRSVMPKSSWLHYLRGSDPKKAFKILLINSRHPKKYFNRSPSGQICLHGTNSLA